MSGYYAARSAAFEYGAGLPDLRPGSPAAAPGGEISRTLTTVVANEGQSAAPATTARFYADGNLLGAATVPVLGMGEQAVVSVPWDIQGQGGEHTLAVAVDPVGEFDETNNEAQASVTLPRLDSGLLLTPQSIAAGEAVTLSLRLENLQGAAALPLAVSVEVRSPSGAVVHRRSWTPTLNGGEERWLEDVWTSGTDAETGGYSVLQEVEDAYGARQVNSAFFIVHAPSGPATYHIYLPW